MPTTNAVPSSDPADLLFNAQKLDEIVNSGAASFTDRLGVSRMTAAGATASIALANSRGNWATATVYAVRDLVLNSGTWYICVVAHTSSALFSTDSASKWRVHQGVMSSDLADTTGAQGSAMIQNKQSGTGAGARSLRSIINDLINVRDFGAKGDGVTDDTTAIQNAINEAQTRTGAEVYFPPRDIGQWYKVTGSLTVTKPIRIRGAGPAAVHIIASAGAIASGSYILDINCAAVDNVEHLTIEGLTIRSADSVPNAIRVKNASYVRLIDVRPFNVANGVDIEGSRCFSNKFDGLVCYGVTGTSVRFLSGFSGGGQFAFKDSTFVGAYGVTLDSTAVVDGMTFDGCNWEGCTTRAMKVQGTLQGCNIEGVRGEGGAGSGFEFAPVAGKEVVGLSISGMSFYSGTLASVPVILGTSAGTGGKVRGFSITGNRVGYAAQTYMVELWAEAASGVIAGNYLQENSPTSMISAQRAGVVVFGNEKGNAKLAEYWGLADWGVDQGTWTPTDGSGAGLSITGAGRYTKIGRAVFWQAAVTYPSTGSTANAEIGGLPFAVGGLGGSAEGRSGARCDVSNATISVGVYQGVTSSTEIAFVNPTTAAALTNTNLSGKTLYLSGTYTM